MSMMHYGRKGVKDCAAVFLAGPRPSQQCLGVEFKDFIVRGLLPFQAS